MTAAELERFAREVSELTRAPRITDDELEQWQFWREAWRTALWDELTLGIPAPDRAELRLEYWTPKYDPERKREVLARPIFPGRYMKMTGVTA